MAADIIKIDFTDLSDSQKGTFEPHFELTDYSNNLTIALAANTTEYLEPYPYRVEGGDLTVTDGGVSNGTVYIHILEDGDGTASAYVDTNKGTWDSNKGGYFYGATGAKVVFKMVKSAGPIYSGKGRLTGKIQDDRLDDDTERAFLYSIIF